MGVLLGFRGAAVYALPLAVYSAVSGLLLAWFARSEGRSLVSVGVPGALLLAAPLVAWEPFVALVAEDSRRVHGYAMALSHTLGVPLLLLGFVLGAALSFRARRQLRRAGESRQQPAESVASSAFLTCLQLTGCLILTVAIGVLGVGFLLALVGG